MVRPYYITYSDYTKRISSGILGRQYMKLSREALREDEMAVTMRRSRFGLEDLMKKRKERLK